MNCMSNDTAVEFQPLFFAVDSDGASRIPSMVFIFCGREGWSPDANENLLDMGFLRGDKGNMERRRGGYAYLSFISVTSSLET